VNRKLPSDAFEFYFSLGVSKKTVVAHALRDGWQKRIVERETKAQAEVEKKAVDTIAQVNEKHLKMLEVVQAKALQALKAMPIDTAYQAVRALATAIEQERVIRGEPGERIDIATIIKKEYEQLMVKPGGQDDWSDLELPAG
jgi:hypothetical protein